jgi:hypothetical protein
MEFRRFENTNPLTKPEKIILLEEYIVHYKNLIAERGLDALNVKIPRVVFEPVLDSIGKKLLDESFKCSGDGAVKQFLDDNPVPENMKELLPDNFRAYSLLLNALKQWVAAESAATDRFLLGGTARQTCRNAIDKCIVTDEILSTDAELHHPIRDGRPPILLSKKGHDLIEQNNQKSNNDDDSEIWNNVKLLKAEKHMSWVQLREGCMSKMLGTVCRPGAKSFANKVIKEIGLDADEIISLLDSKNI